MSQQGNSASIISAVDLNLPFSWSQQFLSLGGYSTLLTRLNEILEVEWRLARLIRCDLPSAKWHTFQRRAT